MISPPVALPAVTDADAAPAHALRVELNTRITTQPLHYRSGDEETAATSVFQLFGKTRELLLAHPKAAAFEVAAVFLLNRVLRPNTARWHRMLVDKEFQDEAARRQFRLELQHLQPRLSAFEALLRLLIAGPAGSAEAAAAFARFCTGTIIPGGLADLGGAVAAGIGTEVSLKSGDLPADLAGGGARFATAQEINAAEARFVHRRRQALGSASEGGDPAAGPLLDATGICLSGGGIRSATFCLGIVQVLARQGLLKQFDYLSTVSGGGYLGTFLSSFLGTPPGAEIPPPKSDGPFQKGAIADAFDDAFQPADGRESAAVRHLRNNSRYLLSGGAWARARIFGLLVTGILTNVLLMLPIPLLSVLGVILISACGYWTNAPWWPGWESLPGYPAGVVFLTLLSALAFFWLLLPVVRNRARGEAPGSPPVRMRSLWETAALVLGLGTLLAGALVLFPPLFHGMILLRQNVHLLGPALGRFAESDAIVAVVSAMAPFVFGLIAARLKAGAGKRVATLLFTLSGPLFYAVTFLIVATRTLDGTWSLPVVIAITAFLTLWGWLFVDINDFSPHGYYRARLCECYLAARHADQTGLVRGLVKRVLHGREPGETVRESSVGKLRQLPLSRMNATGAAPYHLINTAVNLPASREPNLRGRDCDFFTLSRDFCGGPVCGYIPTETLETLDPHVDLGTAMAISGAAASSNMGVQTLRQLRFLLTLLNVRLGYWLRNPLAGRRSPLTTPGPLYLFREMTGWMHEKSGYLNLSDGGHIENLALYELLRRRCKFIVIVDGGMEPGMECADLMLAQRYAQIDLGVQFDLDLADLALNPQRRSRAYAVFGRIRYSDARTGAEDIGWLVYLKLARTGEEPGYVVDYGRRNPDFPHETTGDQLYDEAQFEAYRRLGECAAESLFREEIAGPFYVARQEPVPGFGTPRFATLSAWFQALAGSLLADNDPAFSRGSQSAGAPAGKP